MRSEGRLGLATPGRCAGRLGLATPREVCRQPRFWGTRAPPASRFASTWQAPDKFAHRLSACPACPPPAPPHGPPAGAAPRTPPHTAAPARTHLHRGTTIIASNITQAARRLVSGTSAQKPGIGTHNCMSPHAQHPAAPHPHPAASPPGRTVLLASGDQHLLQFFNLKVHLLEVCGLGDLGIDLQGSKQWGKEGVELRQWRWLWWRRQRAPYKSCSGNVTQANQPATNRNQPCECHLTSGLFLMFLARCA